MKDKLMNMRIRIPSYNVLIAQDFRDFETVIEIKDPATLDSIIEQCQDIKLKLLEAKNNGQNAQV